MKNDTVINIVGMRCASCVNRVEKALNGVDGVDSVSVNIVTKKALVTGDASYELLCDVIEDLGFSVLKDDVDTGVDERSGINKGVRQKDSDGKGTVVSVKVEDYKGLRNRFFIAVIFCLPVFIFSMFSVQVYFSEFLQFLLSTVVLFLIGFEFIKVAFGQIRHMALGMDTLVAVGSVAAYSYSTLNLIDGRHDSLYFDTSSMIVTLILFGRYLEAKAGSVADDAVNDIISLKLPKACVIKDGNEVQTNLSDVVVGDVVVVRPGEKVSVDGIVISGQTDVDESMLSGESMPVSKTTDDKVYAGSINQFGTIKVKVEKDESGTVIAQIVESVENALASKAPVQRLADKVASVFVPFVVTASLVTLAVWLILGYPLNYAFSAAVSVLVIACPCALGLATPAAIVVSAGRAAREGIFIKNVPILELASKTNILIFDKTGTITEGRPAVAKFINSGDYSDDEIYEIVGASQRSSEHPIGKSIMRYIEETGVPAGEADEFRAIPGKGIYAKYKEKELLMGNEQLMSENSIDVKSCRLDKSILDDNSSIILYISVNGEIKGLFTVADTIRSSSKKAIERVKSFGITPVMLTGDSDAAARDVAFNVGIEQYKSGQLPEDKLKSVWEYKTKGNVVGMVGDGVNDAPALAAADVSFAVGSGTDLAIESAEVTVMKGDISKVAETINISRQTMRIIKQNLFWAFGYNVIALPIAALGLLNPMIAAGAMAFSSVSVVTNSLRLRNKGR